MIENHKAINVFLWDKIQIHHKYFDEFGKLATQGKSLEIIQKYIHNIGREEAKYGQLISVKNESIDVALHRHILEATLHNIIIDADLDSLENLSSKTSTEASAQSMVKVIQALENCFKVIVTHKNSRLLLSIKHQDNSIHICVDANSECVFNETVTL